MNDFKKISEARLSGDKKALTEASLGRVWQHTKNTKEKSIAILTSWRASNTQKENQKDFQNLKTQVRGNGLGFFSLKGHWKECQNEDVPYEDCPEEELVDAIEPSLFIIGAPQETIESLSNQYKQDGYIFAGPETDGNIKLVFKDGNSMDLGEYKPQTLGQAFSELVKSKNANPRYFKFEAVEYPVQSWVEALIEQEVKKALETI